MAIAPSSMFASLPISFKYLHSWYAVHRAIPFNTISQVLHNSGLGVWQCSKRIDLILSIISSPSCINENQIVFSVERFMSRLIIRRKTDASKRARFINSLCQFTSVATSVLDPSSLEFSAVELTIHPIRDQVVFSFLSLEWVRFPLGHFSSCSDFQMSLQDEVIMSRYTRQVDRVRVRDTASRYLRIKTSTSFGTELLIDLSAIVFVSFEEKSTIIKPSVAGSLFWSQMPPHMTELKASLCIMKARGNINHYAARKKKRGNGR
mmetsp:Transcript_31741/g.65204  ORF Transcript_31741/g.65204 Transcript_31741/m.65204 type:complete len:263 (+) Transcript_31741:1051-1839(+)